MGTFLQELSRRNVVRTTLAYLAVSWLVVQVADIVLPTFDVAPWAMQALIVVFSAGLPIVVILAWVYDLTPEGMKRTDAETRTAPLAGPLGRKIDFVIIGLLSLALVAMLVNHYVIPAASARLGPRSVIVLPFSTNQDEEGSLLADGLLGEVLTQLYNIDALTTVGRATAMHYRGSDQSVKSIAEEVGVAAVLSGIIIEAVDRARLDVELLEASSGKVLWGDSYELPRTVEGMFRIQTGIATQIAIALEAELSPDEQRLLADKPTTSDVAYDHFIRGEGFRMRFRLQKAVEAYEQATKEDPGFAAAWAALAGSRADGLFTGLVDTTRAEVEFALERARQLAPDAPDTLLAEAQFADPEVSYEILHRVLKLRPGDIEALIGLAQGFTVQLRLEEAREYAERVVALDPMNFMATFQLSFVYAIDWNFSEARRFLDRALALEAESPHPWLFYAHFNVYLWGLGDPAAAKQILEDAPPGIYTTYMDIELAYVNRDLETMRALLDAIEGNDGNGYWYARLHRLAGDIELQEQYAESWRVAIEDELESLLSRGASSLDVENERSYLAVAHALAGNEAEAIRIITLAVERTAANPDRFNALNVNWNEVLTYTFLGQSDVAIERLRVLLSPPTRPELTPYRLRMDPDFDALRDHPDFDAVLAEAQARMN
jgi:TolB-like protein